MITVTIEYSAVKQRDVVNLRAVVTETLDDGLPSNPVSHAIGTWTPVDGLKARDYSLQDASGPTAQDRERKAAERKIQQALVLVSREALATLAFQAWNVTP